VTIYAYTAYGYSFLGWSGVGPGAYTGTSRIATIIVNGNVTQTATFIPYVFYTLTMTASVGGIVTPATSSYPAHTPVTIRALPDPG
jgi:hypothetical protein